jgi:membrane-bound serine protease (ClpP class)
MKNMQIKKFICFVFFVLLLLTTAGPGFCEDQKKQVHIIPVEGQVGPAMAAFLKRAVANAKKDDAKLIIFEIDTFGGRVDSALEIVDALLTVDKDISVSYVKTKAISAGALISLASGRLYMRKGTTIGDCAPIVYSKEGAKEVGEKFQSPLRAKFRALAKRNGFSERMAESMVSKDKEIVQVVKDNKPYYFGKDEFNEMPEEKRAEYKSLKTVVKKGELLTMDDIEAKRFSFSKASVADIDELFSLLKIEKSDVIRITQTWSEIIAGYLIAISPILMMIGLAGIYLEFKTPGFGIPGTIGVICLGLALSSQYMAGLASYTELLIILAGVIFIAVEIFVIPGFGVAGILGIVLIFTGMVLALQGFTLPDPELPWELDIFIHNIISVLAICTFSMLLSILAFRYLLPHIPIAGRGPFLNATLKNSHADSFESMGINIGDKGVALSLLRPSGKADFNGNRVDVLSQSEYINKGEMIEVIELTKNKIIVEKQEV